MPPADSVIRDFFREKFEEKKVTVDFDLSFLPKAKTELNWVPISEEEVSLASKECDLSSCEGPDGVSYKQLINQDKL